MNTDRELLELAAKADRIEADWNNPDCAEYEAQHEGMWLRGERSPDNSEFWNPLRNDGDALRLAVKLSISLDVGGMFVHADTRHCAKDIGYFEENSARHNSCIATATRRAIVRAAAEIGKSMP